MPFLPTLIDTLERHHHLHLSEACRDSLLSMSAATADRLLRSSREHSSGSPSTTRAGTWLKQHIPLRTYEQWNETQPGFLEVDLVAHCGNEAQGSFLSTLTLTDIATGWTECLPLRSKNAEEVLSAFRTARVLFPFPILGLDVDNGGEFINEHLLTYCEEEGLTFTRGRPDLKNDQCFVEQKNGAVVRLVCFLSNIHRNSSRINSMSHFVGLDRGIHNCPPTRSRNLDIVRECWNMSEIMFKYHKVIVFTHFFKTDKFIGNVHHAIAFG